MKNGTPELCFASRSDFRDWLRDNAETSCGVWLVFGKTKAVVSPQIAPKRRAETA